MATTPDNKPGPKPRKPPKPAAVAKQRKNNVGGVTGKGFQPGQSGNPTGRPKGKTLTGRLRETLDRDDNAQRVVDALVVAALAGDRQAIKDIFDRIEGKVLDKIEHSEAPPAPHAIPDDDPRFLDDGQHPALAGRP